MTKPVETRWWWLRHAPVPGHPGMIHGRGARVSLHDAAIIERWRALLPTRAVWLASDLPRAIETAHALGRDPEAKLAELAEQDFGAWTGHDHDALWASGDPVYRRFWDAPADTAPPDGESFAACAARVAAAIHSLCDRHAGQDVVAVAHAGTIRAALALALGLPAAAALAFSVEPWSLTRIDRVESAWRVLRVNVLP